MKTLELYASYSELMNKMNALYSNYQRLIAEGASAEKRIEAEEQIAACRSKITSVVNKITTGNPFREAYRKKRNAPMSEAVSQQA